MNTLTIRDFQSRPRQARASLGKQRETVLTANGRPVAVMIPVDSGTLDTTLDALRRARAQQALRALRQSARERRLDRLPMAAIDAVVAKARSARRRLRRTPA